MNTANKSTQKTSVFGLLFYLSSLILVIQIVPVGATLVSERYSYIPYIGLLFILGNYYVTIQDKKFKAPATLKSVLPYLTLAIVLLFSIIAYQQSRVWSNDISLFSDIAEKNPGSSPAHFEYGNVLSDAGNYPEALMEYNRSIELDSTVAEVYFYRGTVFYNQKDTLDALHDYQKAVQLKPDYAEAYYNIGTMHAEAGRIENAIRYFNRSIAIQPNEYMYNSRGTSYYFLQRYKEAIEDYTSALSINPGFADLYFNRGVAYSAIHQDEAACSDLKKALSLGHPKASDALALYCK